MLVTIVPMNVRMSPMMAGIITQEVLSSGLYRILVLTLSPDLLSTDTIDCEANRFEPSTRASTGLWPVTMATLTVLSCSSRSASAWLSDGWVTVTLKNDDGNVAANWVARGPTTAALTVLTSKLAAYPKITSSRSGIAINIARVRLSRRSSRNSLTIIARMAQMLVRANPKCNTC